MIIFALATDVPYIIPDKTDTEQDCWRGILASPQALLPSLLSGCRLLMMLAQVTFAMVMVLRSSSVSLCPWKLDIIKGRIETLLLLLLTIIIIIIITIIIIIMLPEHSDNGLTLSYFSKQNFQYVFFPFKCLMECWASKTAGKFEFLPAQWQQCLCCQN